MEAKKKDKARAKQAPVKAKQASEQEDDSEWGNAMLHSTYLQLPPPPILTILFCPPPHTLTILFCQSSYWKGTLAFNVE